MPVVAASSAVSIVARAGLASATGRGVSRARAPRPKPSAAANTRGVVVVARSSASSSASSTRRPDASTPRLPAFASRSIREMTAVNAAAASSSSSSAAADDALFLGLDFGTSGARATVVDNAGAVVTETTARYPPIVDGGKGGDGVPEGGWAEAWRGALWSLLDRLDADVRARVAAVAVDGTSGTVLIVDRESGEPVYPPMLYNEKRGDAMDFVCAVAPEGHTVRSPTSALCKLHSWWVSNGERGEGDFALLHHADWIAHLLHGVAGETDHNNALKLGFDPGLGPCGDYPAWMKSLPYASMLPGNVRAPGTKVSPIATARARKVLTNPSGCVVVAGTTDSIAAFVAARCTTPGDAVTSLGSSLALKLVSTVRVDDSAKGVYSHRLCGSWLVGGSSNLGGWLLRSNFSDDELVALTDKIDLEDVGKESSVPDYYPGVLMGFGMTVKEATDALSPRPDADEDFLRAILGSVAGVEARSYREMASMGASNVARVFTAGGGAKNPKWSTIRSRAMGGIPVTASEFAEASYGSALLARMGHYDLPTYVPEE